MMQRPEQAGIVGGYYLEFSDGNGPTAVLRVSLARKKGRWTRPLVSAASGRSPFQPARVQRVRSLLVATARVWPEGEKPMVRSSL